MTTETTRETLRECVEALRPFVDAPTEYLAGGIYEVLVNGRDVTSARAALAAAEAALAQPATPAIPVLGVGAFVIHHSAAGEVPEVLLVPATDRDREGRAVGEDRPNEPGFALYPEEVAFRIRFANVAGLDALEKRLGYLRAEHFPGPAAATPERAAGEPLAPSGYAYRYSDGIRFNGGREVNGCQPIEAIPYWLYTAPPAAPAWIEGKPPEGTEVAWLHLVGREVDEEGGWSEFSDVVLAVPDPQEPGDWLEAGDWRGGSGLDSVFAGYRDCTVARWLPYDIPSPQPRGA